MSRTRIQDAWAWEILDSRGKPTVAASVRLADGAVGTASVPSGASVGRHEAHELRDGGQRYAGHGVRRAVDHVRTQCHAAVVGRDAADQCGIDAALRAADGTPNLSHLGANAVLAVSVAAANAAAASAGVPLYRWIAEAGTPAGPGASSSDGPIGDPADGVDTGVGGTHGSGTVHAGSAWTNRPLLPLPMVNVVSGGAHASHAVDIQDVLVVPLAATSFAEALEHAARVRRATAEVAADDHGQSQVGLVADEGGLGVRLASNRAALELVVRGIERAGMRPGVDAALAIDVAANQLWRSESYTLAAERRSFTAEEWIAHICGWARDLPVVSIEDPCADEDWAAWSTLSRALPQVQLLGDDLFVTMLTRLERGVCERIANAVLVKPNQNGTLTGAAEVTRYAQQAAYATVVSARSGETEDAWMADLAVGWAAGQIKVGSTTRSERTAKWNRLLRIEAELGSEAAYAGPAALAHAGSTTSEGR